MPEYTLRIDDRTASIRTWDASEPLLYVLRRLGRAGAHVGCGAGQCGTCTVLLDGEPVRSCLVPIRDVGNRRVTTVEGLGTPERPDRVQAAFIAEGAAQCGYCTPGMVLAAHALLRKTPDPSVDDVKTALDGHLCRCGAYPRIIRAVLRAAREGRRNGGRR